MGTPARRSAPLSSPALKDHGWHGSETMIPARCLVNVWQSSVNAHPSNDFERIASTKLSRYAHEVRMQLCISKADHFRGLKFVLLTPAFGFLIAYPCGYLAFIIRHFPKRKCVQIFGFYCRTNAIEFAFTQTELIEGSYLFGGTIHIACDLNSSGPGKLQFTSSRNDTSDGLSNTACIRFARAWFVNVVHRLIRLSKRCDHEGRSAEVVNV